MPYIYMHGVQQGGTRWCRLRIWAEWVRPPPWFEGRLSGSLQAAAFIQSLEANPQVDVALSDAFA